MNISQSLVLGVTVLVILACSGCVGGGSNAQTFDTGFGQIQINAPETLVPTLGSISAIGMLSLGKKDGMPILIITLKKSDEYFNFQNAVSTAKLMTPLNDRDLTTNDNHEMYWNIIQGYGFKQYEGIIDYKNDYGLFVDIKGLSDTIDPLTGKSSPGFSENEYLDIIKSFKFVESGSKSQTTQQSTQPQSTTQPTETNQAPAQPNQTVQEPALKQQTKVSGEERPTNGTGGTVIVAFRDLPLLGIKNVGHVGVAFQNKDGTWSAGAVEGPGFPFQILNALPGMENGAWVEYLKDKSKVIEEFSHKDYDKIKTIEVFSDTDPIAAQKIMNGFFGRGYDVELNNCLTATHEVLTAYGCKYLPSAFDNILGRSTTPISYFNQLAGEEIDLKAGTSQNSDTSVASTESAPTSTLVKPGKFEIRIQTQNNETEHVLYGDAVESVDNPSNNRGMWGVPFTLSEDGAKILQKAAIDSGATRNPKAHELSMYFDKDQIFSAPLTPEQASSIKKSPLRTLVAEVGTGDAGSQKANVLYIHLKGEA